MGTLLLLAGLLFVLMALLALFAAWVALLALRVLLGVLWLTLRAFASIRVERPRA